MNRNNFEKLIHLVTGRDFNIRQQAGWNDYSQPDELMPETRYNVYRILPVTGRTVSFDWTTPKADERFLRSFITSFTSKYREPDPHHYDREYGGKQYRWEDKTEQEKEYAYTHHVSNMYSKKELLAQVEANFKNETITNGLIRYGFYPTEYGVGIFCYWLTDAVQEAVKTMHNFLKTNGIPYSNEYSDARWVYRFKLNISKETHTQLLAKLTPCN